MIQVMVMDQLVGRGLIPQNRRFDSYCHYFPEPELGAIKVMTMDQLVGQGLSTQNRRFDSCRHYFLKIEGWVDL